MANQRTDLLLDFDACKSVVKRGVNKDSYLLKPVIKVIPFVLNGINGYVHTSLLDGTNSKNVSVSAQQNGAILRATAPMPGSGQFILGNLALGSYDVVVAADGHATVVIAGVPVTDATSTVPVSTQSAPINPPTSATATIGGNITLNPANADVVAYVTAKQTLEPGPTVTVKSQPADQLDGSYSLTLPKAAPLLGTYATPLPIALTDAAQGSVAGQYKVEAAAEGYVTQSADADISMADVTQDFVLVVP